MERDLEVPEWAQQWLSRTHPRLQSYTLLMTYTLAAILLYTGISTLILTRRDQAAATAEPSARAEIFHKATNRIQSITRRSFFISCIFLLHALAIWCVDAGIGIGAIWNDIDDNPSVWDAAFILELAIRSMGMLAMFIVVFFAFPFLQMLGLGYLLSRSYSEEDTYVPGMRVLTTHFAQMWLMLGFFFVAWWPVFEYSTIRLLALEAVFGSGLMWLHASYTFNFCAQPPSQVEVRPLLGLRDGDIRVYGRQLWTMHPEKLQERPQYDSVARAEQGEKTAV